MLAGVLAGTATAGTWTWTEAKAESWARAHVHYLDKKAYRQDIAYRRARAQRCKDPQVAAIPEMQCKYADAYYKAGLTQPRSDYVRYPRTVDCRGAGRSRDGKHFVQFRCEARFSARRSYLRVTVTGKSRAAWRWI